MEDIVKGRRFCYHVPADGFIEGRGYRASIVIENESGHYPTGTWPYEGKLGQVAPYFWGMTLDEAKAVCVAQNKRMGVSERDAVAIVSSSIAATRFDPSMNK